MTGKNLKFQMERGWSSSFLSFIIPVYILYVLQCNAPVISSRRPRRPRRGTDRRHAPTAQNPSPISPLEKPPEPSQLRHPTTTTTTTGLRRRPGRIRRRPGRQRDLLRIGHGRSAQRRRSGERSERPVARGREEPLAQGRGIEARRRRCGPSCSGD